MDYTITNITLISQRMLSKVFCTKGYQFEFCDANAKNPHFSLLIKLLEIFYSCAFGYFSFQFQKSVFHSNKQNKNACNNL